MISNLTVAMLGMVDTAVVGHLDNAWYLGGVSLAMVIFNFLYWGFAFLRMGTTGIIAQQLGAANADRIRSSLAQALVLASMIVVLILLCRGLIADFSFSILKGSAEVKQYARLYFDWAIWAAPAVFFNLVITGWLLGMQSASSVLVLSVFINILNILLDVILVWHFNLDVRGVALATVISQYAGLFAGFIFCHKILKQHVGQWRRQLILHLHDIREMLLVNHYIFIRTLSLIFVFAFFTHQGAGQGDSVLAANAVLMNFYLMMALGIDGFAIASETLSGKYIGARDRKSFWLYVKLSFLWGFIFAAVFSILFLVAGQHIISFMTSIEDIQKVAGECLPWLILAPLLAFVCFIWDGVFIGARRAYEMQNSMVFSVFIIFLPTWYFSQSLANHGLWLAMSVFLLMRSLSMCGYAYHIEKTRGFINSA